MPYFLINLFALIFSFWVIPSTAWHLLWKSGCTNGGGKVPNREKGRAMGAGEKLKWTVVRSYWLSGISFREIRNLWIKEFKDCELWDLAIWINYDFTKVTKGYCQILWYDTSRNLIGKSEMGSLLEPHLEWFPWMKPFFRSPRDARLARVEFGNDWPDFYPVTLHRWFWSMRWRSGEQRKTESWNTRYT